MPIPKPNEETREQWISRCIPVVINEGTTDNPAQAAAICFSMWRDALKKERKNNLALSP